MKRSRSTEGFTLIEMSIVVLIMGSMAAMAAPGLSEWMADTRASGAAEGLLRLNRVVRARVNETGLAHLLLFRASDDAEGRNGLGNVQLWEGMNNRCNQTPWIQAIDNHQMIDGLDLGDPAYNLPVDGRAPSVNDVGRQVVRLTNNVDPKLLVLCFEPGGNTLTAVSDGESPSIGFRFTTQTTPVVFIVNRSIARTAGSPVTRGRDRAIIFPAGGNGRLSL
jgi:prepilin-type N-terminal cleavage/methylation domain-containing protein